MLTQKEIVEQMRAFMEQNEMTQKEMASAIGVSNAAVCMWLKDKRNIAYKNAVAISELLQTKGEANGNGKTK